jgi:Na+-transporting NADH:ubiquinone oxidoreductase subunit NqrC
MSHNKDSLQNTVKVALLLCVVCSVVVSSAAVFAKEYDSVAINLAGRQRMLHEKYAREIYEVLVSQAASDLDTAGERKIAASRTAELYEATLAVLLDSGEVDAGAAGRIMIPPVSRLLNNKDGQNFVSVF